MIATICCYYNFCGYKNPLRNFNLFKQQFDKHFYSVELSLGDFETDSYLKIKGSDANLMWQKEKLLNLLVDKLPDYYDKIIWIDADLILPIAAKQWIGEINDLLKDVKVVQPFSSISWYDKSLSKVTHTMPTAMYSYLELEQVGGVPGGCLAGSRELFPIFDMDISGNSDQVFFWSSLGVFDFDVMNYMTKPLKKECLKWAISNFQKVEKSVAYLPYNLKHLYHGELNNRAYLERTKFLLDNEFNPSVHLFSNEQIWQWTDVKFSRYFSDYFKSRKEDG